MSELIKSMFVELDEEGNPIEEIVEETKTKKKVKPKPKSKTKAESPKEDESLLHDSDHNIVEFPSKGEYGYPETFEYRDMLVRDEEILATAKATTYSRTLNSVLKGIMNNPTWYEDMVVSDRDFALMWIWAQNYGATKELSVTCSNAECGEVGKHIVDLGKLPMVEIDTRLPRPYTMELKSGATVTVHSPTVADEMFVEDWISKWPDAAYDIVMSARIIKLKMEPVFSAKLEWIRDNITGPELGKIRRYQEHAWFGVNPEVKYTCQMCKEVTLGEIPFSASDILWPTVHADIEEFL